MYGLVSCPHHHAILTLPAAAALVRERQQRSNFAATIALAQRVPVENRSGSTR